MPSVRGFLRSKPKTDDGEGELAESELVARLAGLFGEIVADPVDADGHLPAGVQANGATSAHDIVLPAVARPEPATNGARRAERPYLGRPPIIVIGDGPIIVPAPEPVGVMARAGDDVGEDTWRLPAGSESTPVAKPGRKRASRARKKPVAEPPAELPTAAGLEITELPAAELEAASPALVADLVPAPEAVAEAGLDAAPAAVAEIVTEEAPDVEPVSGPVAGSEVTQTGVAEASPAVAPAAVETPAKRSHQKKPLAVVVARARPAVVSAVHCPYCGVLLDPPPATSRKCEECQQRIIVKRIEGRAVYLAGAALPVFTAERRRIANSARLTRERSRWLDLATAAGAPSRAIAQLRIARASDANVAAARQLYLLAVDRTFRMARRDKEWEVAARLRRDEATAIFRAEGSPRPPSAEMVELYREGVACELRGIAEISRDAQLVAATCCAACRADDEVVTRIGLELREPRLPHADCPKGLCRCHWDLAARDRTTLLRYLRRRSPGASRAGSTETPPSR